MTLLTYTLFLNVRYLVGTLSFSNIDSPGLFWTSSWHNFIQSPKFLICIRKSSVLESTRLFVCILPLIAFLLAFYSKTKSVTTSAFIVFSISHCRFLSPSMRSVSPSRDISSFSTSFSGTVQVSRRHSARWVGVANGNLVLTLEDIRSIYNSFPDKNDFLVVWKKPTCRTWIHLAKFLTS